MEQGEKVFKAVMGLLLDLLLLDHLTVVTYGKAENCYLAATPGTGKRLGVGGWALNGY